jgi:hypothetical protein
MVERKTPQKSSAAIPSREELQALQAANLTARVGQATRQMDIEQERTKALIADLSKRRVT